MDLEPPGFWRIVVLKKGKLKPTEFRLREGETGLSVFLRVEQPGRGAILDAVRAAGKQGSLRTAHLADEDIRRLGLRPVRTAGATVNVHVNQLHYELRMPFLKRLVLRLQGVALHDFFNGAYADELCAVAKVVDWED